MLRQQKFLAELLERLNDDAGQKEVMAEITSVRKILTRLNNMVLFMAANVEKLTVQVPDMYAPWNIHFSDLATSEKATWVYLEQISCKIHLAKLLQNNVLITSE